MNIADYDDYGPNGLQIEGKSEIKKIAYAVSATQESARQAVEHGADCLIVHHGLFWKFHGVRTLTGSFAKRVAPLVRNEINLLGYHLPLDGHQEVGNAVTLAHKLGLTNLRPFGQGKTLAPIGCHGEFKKALSCSELKEKIEHLLGRACMVAEVKGRPIKTLGIITGGANSQWREAQKLGLDSYLTGEMSEHDWHEAKEGEVHFFAAGHHATEQFGVQALREVIEKKFEVEGIYLTSDNPA